MISHCMKTDTGFGVCLIREGQEVGRAAEFHEVGTLAKVVDFHMQRDGVLGIVVKGESRFRVKNSQIAKNQLVSAEVEYFDEEPVVSVPEEFGDLMKMVESTFANDSESLTKLLKVSSDASWLGFRLAEMLPLRLSQKQYFLQLHEPLLRLERIDDVIHQLDTEA